MILASGCPDAATVENLLLGRLAEDEARRIEQHLAGCDRCAQTMSSLRADDPLVEAVRHSRRYFDDTPDEALLRGVIHRFKKMRPPEAPTLGWDDVSPSGSQPVFPFLGPPQASDELGRLGPYRILQLLGAGGMGVVFRAHDPRLDRHVAVKAIKPDLAGSDAARAHFLEEARAVAAMEHDHIVAIFDVGEQQGVPWLAMPLLRGESLEDRIKREGPLPIDEVLRVGREVAVGLAAAHAKGFVHRDIKPANIWLEEIADGGLRIAESKTSELSTSPSPDAQSAIRNPQSAIERVKILDFGLARPAARELGIARGAIAGTPEYMAPEQACGEKLDGRADLFSLGCVLYRMVTGEPPFHSDNILSTLMLVATETPRPMRELNADVPPELAAVIDRLLAKKRDDRYPDARAVADALAAIEEARRPRERPWLSRRGLFLLTGSVVAASAGLTYWLTRRDMPSPEPPPEPGELRFEFDEPAMPVTLRDGDGTEMKFDLKQGMTQSLPAGEYTIRAVDVSPRRRLWPERWSVKAGEPTTWRLRLVGEIDRYAGHSGVVRGVAVLPRGKPLVLGASEDRSVSVWDPTTKALKQPFEGDGDRKLRTPMFCVALSPDGRFAVSGGGGKNPRDLATAYLWDVRDAHEVGRFEDKEDWVTAVAFAPDGKTVLIGDSGGKLERWGVTKFDRLNELKGHDSRVTGIAFCKDGRAVSGGLDKRLLLWDPTKGAPLRAFDGHPDSVQGVAFAWDGSRIASACDDGIVRLWEPKGDKPIELKGHKKGVASVAFSLDGKRLLSGGGDGKLRLWDVAGAKELWCFDGHRDTVTSVAFCADGRRAVSGGVDKTIRFWELPA